MTKSEKMDISAVISHAWATSDPEDYVSPSIGLAQVDGIIRRVEVFGKYLLLVDEGQLVPFRNAQLRPATKEILNIPPLAFPVVLSDFETLTDRQITKLDELVMGYIIYQLSIQIWSILKNFYKNNGYYNVKVNSSFAKLLKEDEFELVFNIDAKNKIILAN